MKVYRITIWTSYNLLEIVMGRPSAGSGFTISQLENMLLTRRSHVDSLGRERARILKQLHAVDEKIKKLGGDVRGAGTRGNRTLSLTAGGRARNPKSLVATLADVLKGGAAMSVGDIVAAIEATGYQSNSVNFRAIVNQTLIKERKRFGNTGRGMYAIK